MKNEASRFSEERFRTSPDNDNLLAIGVDCDGRHESTWPARQENLYESYALDLGGLFIGYKSANLCRFRMIDLQRVGKYNEALNFSIISKSLAVAAGLIISNFLYEKYGVINCGTCLIVGFLLESLIYRVRINKKNSRRNRVR